jgi:hypothetical protein
MFKKIYPLKMLSKTILPKPSAFKVVKISNYLVGFTIVLLKVKKTAIL